MLTLLQFALARIPRSKSAGLYASYTKFEKQFGTRTTLETTVLGKRRIQYEEELSHDGRNYDVWFDYARLEEGAFRDLRGEGATADEEEAAMGRVREVYERAVAQVPPGGEKRHWRRYIFLWLDYALFEEIETKVCVCSFSLLRCSTTTQDYERARQIYQTAVTLVPHKTFTFAKLWIMFARFEVRRLDLPAARKILGSAIGLCPKEKLFKGYIELETDVRISCCICSNISLILSVISYVSLTASENSTKNISRFVSFPSRVHIEAHLTLVRPRQCLRLDQIRRN